jgi:hypothetical protein
VKIRRFARVNTGTFTFVRLLNRWPLPTAMLTLLLVVATSSSALAETAGNERFAEMTWFILLLVGIMFLIIAPFSAWYIYTGRKGVAQSKASQSWPTTEGKIIESGVREIHGRQRGATQMTYWPFVRYEYNVGGTRYEADVIQFGMSEQPTMMKADAFVFERPVGKVCTVHYNPDDPKVATLDTSAQSAQTRIRNGWLMLFLLPAFTGIVLALIMWFAL